MVDVSGPALREAISNLIINAVEALLPAGGRVTVETSKRPSPPAAIVSVGDTDPGIPEPVPATMVWPFFRAKGTGNMGFGLPVAKQWVEGDGGPLLYPADPDRRAPPSSSGSPWSPWSRRR